VRAGRRVDIHSSPQCQQGGAASPGGPPQEFVAGDADNYARESLPIRQPIPKLLGFAYQFLFDALDTQHRNPRVTSSPRPTALAARALPGTSEPASPAQPVPTSLCVWADLLATVTTHADGHHHSYPARASCETAPTAGQPRDFCAWLTDARLRRLVLRLTPRWKGPSDAACRNKRGDRRHGRAMRPPRAPEDVVGKKTAAPWLWGPRSGPTSVYLRAFDATVGRAFEHVKQLKGSAGMTQSVSPNPPPLKAI
jgi:hypothetical protein